MDMNVLKLPGTFRFYIRHPLKFFRHIFSSLKCARLRATQGWCPGDAWEMFMWLGTVIPDMLRYGCRIRRYGFTILDDETYGRTTKGIEVGCGKLMRIRHLKI